MGNLIKETILSSSFKDSLLVMASSAVGSVLGFVFLSLLARSVGAEQFGIYSTITSYILFLSTIVDLGINQSLVKFVAQVKEEEKKKIITTSFYSVFISTIGLSLFFSLVYEFLLKKIWHYNDHYFFLIFISIITFSLFVYFLAVFQSLKKFFQRSLVDILYCILRLIFVAVLLYFFVFNVQNALIIVNFSYGLVFVLTLVLLKKFFIFPYFNREKWKSLIEFSKWFVPNNIFVNLFYKLDILMLPAFLSAYQVGLYSAAARFMIIFPLSINSLIAVFSTRFSQFKNKEECHHYLRSSLTISALVFAVLASLFLLGKYLILFAYSSEFSASVKIFQFLVLAYLPLILTVPFYNAIVYFYKKPQLMTLILGLQVLIFFILNLFFIPKQNFYGPIYSLFIVNTLTLFVEIGIYFGRKRKILY
ncbi:oligosaccharide flippase family protein [Candidatus Beckwithbacteria bacterium]|nr:oligosaccharide flippase family protein [Candidatus Beckwithbacteria bacterium]